MEFLAVLPTKDILIDMEHRVSQIPYASYASWFEVVEAVLRTWVNDDLPAFMCYKDYLTDHSYIREGLTYELLHIGLSPFSRSNNPTMDQIEYERNSHLFYEYAVPLIVDVILCYYNQLSTRLASYLEQYYQGVAGAAIELHDIFWGDVCISFKVN